MIMEILILISALGLAVMIIIVRGFQYAPSELSEFELARRADEGDGTAAYELYRRPLLPALSGLRSFKVVVLTSLLSTLLVATHDWWLGLVILLVIWIMAEIAINKGWFMRIAHRAQQAIEPRIISVVHHVSAVAKHLAPRHGADARAAVGSRAELLHIIDADKTFLSAQEKQRVQAALAFDDIRIRDVMVSRDNIATVNIKETVGPILLDRLHKDGHNVFVVVKKDIDDIKGLLYMADATSGHPDIKTVKDAVRPSVPYVPADAPLSHILGAALSTGRQFFIATDGKGKTLGLITLADVLQKMQGSPVEPIQTYRSPDFAE